MAEYNVELAKSTYVTCAACHGQNGEGGQIGPPLAGNQWVTGPAENLIKIQLRGIQGDIHPQPGVKWEGAVNMMAPNAWLSDDQIAAVLSHVRNSWGNEASVVAAADVTALRDEVGKPMLTEAELIPVGAAGGAAAAGEEVIELKEKKDAPEAPNELGLPVLGTLAVLGWIAVCALAVLGGLAKNGK